MAFFENIGKKVSEAAQAAAKKSSELVEVTKLNSSINLEEDKIGKIHEQIGKIMYDKFTAGEEIFPEVNELCAEIRVRGETVNELKLKILEVKNLRICDQCGTELERNIAFCSKCGAKQEPLKPSGETEEDTEEGKASSSFCPSCGATVDKGTAFCSKCGAKI